MSHIFKNHWIIFRKLDKASQGCGELDLPLFGEELTPDFEPDNSILKDLKEKVKKIKNCEPNPDQNIYY